MSAHTILVCNITPGREDEARGVLRDYAAHLEGHGAQVTIYRNLYAGEQSGRLLVYAAAPTTAARAAFIDRVLGDAPNNPYSKAMGPESGSQRPVANDGAQPRPGLADAAAVEITAGTGDVRAVRQARRGPGDIPPHT